MGRRIARPAEKAADVRATLRRLLGYLAPHWGQLLIAGVMVIVDTLTRIATPYLTGRAVDEFIMAGDRAGLRRVMLWLLGLYLAGVGARAVQTLATVKMGQEILYTMRAQLFEHLQRLSVAFFDQREAGDLMSRLTNDTQVINRTLNMGVAQFVGNLFFLAGVLVAMLLMNWQLALISMGVLPLMVVSTRYFSRRVRQASRTSREKLGAISSELEENISGVRVVQAFGREREAMREFRAVNAENRDANVQAQTVSSAFRPTLDVFSSVGIALVLGLGGRMALAGALTVGTIVAFLTYVRRFFQPVRAIGALYAQVQTAIAAAERIFELLDTPADIQDAPSAEALTAQSVAGHIVFDHVTFGYDEAGEQPVLRDVSFEAQPGQMVAIVGPTGAGKTTMVNLLMRFYDVWEGRILVDGRDIREVQQESLRAQVGMVLQDTFLFAATVRENLRYGRLDASDAEIEAAAKVAGADRFIRRLPEGYDTELGESGASLSQGQRQLLAIARAVLADPRILILDEATSSVDTRTERVIQAAMEKLMRRRNGLRPRTSLVIAHRLSTIHDADLVLVVRDGRIIERGTHRSLLADGGFYYRLYASQFDAPETENER